jgi:O-antigen/teichoic acid export membrane protein
VLPRIQLRGHDRQRPRRAGARLSAVPSTGSDRELSLVPNSLALIAAKLATLGSGFVFWVLAARLFEPSAVGLGAAAVSGMMLCSQLALVGAGSAVIARFRSHERNTAGLVNAALTLVAVAALVIGALFVALSGSGLLSELDVIASDTVYALIFVAATLLGTVGVVIDQASTVLRRGDQALVRGVVFGSASIGTLVLLAALGGESSMTILAPWVVAGAVMLATASVQLRHSVVGYHLRPSSDWPLVRELTRAGIPNHLLTLAERTPGLVLPIFVTELLSPGDNAAWYVAWMMAWVVFMVPVQVGMTTFAEGARNPEHLAGVLRGGLRTSLAIGIPLAVVTALLAGPLLPLLGDTYASDGRGPLRVLLLGVLPLSFTYAYYAACRATGALRQGISTAWTVGVVSVAAAVVAGNAEGLTAMAAAWVAVQLAAGIWSAWRLRALVRDAPE